MLMAFLLAGLSTAPAPPEEPSKLSALAEDTGQPSSSMRPPGPITSRPESTRIRSTSGRAWSWTAGAT